MALVWIIKANYVEDYRVHLTFNDGVSGIVDFKNHLTGQVFEPLKNVDFFRKFELDSWTLTWPNDSDFAPEFLYELTLKMPMCAKMRGVSPEIFPVLPSR